MYGVTVRRAHEGPVVRQAGEARSVVSRLGESRPAIHLTQLTDFVEFFGASLPILRSSYWLLDGVTFCTPASWDVWYDADADRYRGPEADEFQAAHVASRGRLSLVGPGFVERYGQYIVDDWCCLVGLGEAPPEPDTFLAGLAGAPSPRDLEAFEPTVTAAYYCIDGQHWEVFSQEFTVIGAIREALSGRTDVLVREQTVERSFG